MIDMEMCASWHLLELMQHPARSSQERCDIFESLVLLNSGFWQPANCPRRETLKGYATRVARKAIEAVVTNGVRRGALDPDDLAQDLLLAFFRSAHTIQTNPRGWFVGVAVRMVRNELRRNGRFLHAAVVDDLSQVPAVKHDAPASHPQPMSAVAWEAIENLAPTYGVVVRRILQRGTTEEIARELGIRPAAVRQRLCRGRRLLRAQCFRGHPQEPGGVTAKSRVTAEPLVIAHEGR